MIPRGPTPPFPPWGAPLRLPAVKVVIPFVRFGVREKKSMTPPPRLPTRAARLSWNGKIYASRCQESPFAAARAGTVINMAGGYGLTAEGLINNRRKSKVRIWHSLPSDGKNLSSANLPGNCGISRSTTFRRGAKSTFKFVARRQHAIIAGPIHHVRTSSDKTLDAVWDLMKHKLFTLRPGNLSCAPHFAGWLWGMVLFRA